jgi:CheY-like chemotaxis protein
MSELDGNGGAGGRRPLVVLAEDDDDTRRVYGLILRHYGYDVADAPTGEEAVAATRRLHPDIVLMDIGLPGIDGWEASQILKSDPLTLTIPLLAFSARVTSTDDLVARSGCFDGFILKPISPIHLVNRVDAYLQLRREAHEPFGSATLFADEFEAPRSQPAK